MCYVPHVSTRPKSPVSGTCPPNNNSDVANLYICPICDDPIIERTESTPGDDAIHCDGTGDGWLHRGCAGLSRSAFLSASKSDSKFLCPHCHLCDLTSEVVSLKSIVANLSKELASIKSQFLPSDHQLSCPGATPSSATINPPLSKQPTTSSSNSKKYNIVIYGIKEHPVGTPKFKRQQGDLQEIINTFSKVDKSVPPQSIKDHYRLGKFKQSLHRPRPILVTLNSTTDVYSLLSKRSAVKPPLLIKPDLSRQERSFESVLLSERWSLLQSGIDSN